MSSNNNSFVDQASKKKKKKKKPPTVKTDQQNQNPPPAAPAPSTSSINNEPDRTLNGGKAVNLVETFTAIEVNNNLDNVLENVKQLDNTCDFVTCRSKTTLIGHDCPLCTQRFCMKHRLPEVHGCGGSAKKQERAEFMRIPPKPTPKQVVKDHNMAQKRLEKKLKEMSLSRKKGTK